MKYWHEKFASAQNRNYSHTVFKKSKQILQLIIRAIIAWCKLQINKILPSLNCISTIFMKVYFSFSFKVALNLYTNMRELQYSIDSCVSSRTRKYIKFSIILWFWLIIFHTLSVTTKLYLAHCYFIYTEWLLKMRKMLLVAKLLLLLLAEQTVDCLNWNQFRYVWQWKIQFTLLLIIFVLKSFLISFLNFSSNLD